MRGKTGAPVLVADTALMDEFPRSGSDKHEMTEFFRGGLTTQIISFSSTVFLLAYAGFVLLERWKSPFHRHVVSAIGAALAAIVVGLALYTANATSASARGQAGTADTISPLELHRSIGSTSLPVQQIEDHTFVFSPIN
jgi:hypothetical protein